MGRCIGLVGCVLFIVAAVLDGAAAQTTHVVLDNLGWIIPSSGANQYATWASTKTFRVGDTLNKSWGGNIISCLPQACSPGFKSCQARVNLVFNFSTNQHDVAEVSETDYNSCNGNNPKSSILRTGLASITLTSEGNHYYICTFSQHCSLGQKLEINVRASSGNAPTSSPPTTSGPTSHTLPPSSATTPPANCMPTPTPAPTAHTPSNSPIPTSISTILVANLAVLFLSIAICFLVEKQRRLFCCYSLICSCALIIDEGLLIP